MSGDALLDLANTIRQRRTAAADSSYTRQLLDAGAEKCAKKFGEEAAELVFAAAGNDPSKISAEAADVLYHLLVLLEVRGVALSDVLHVLESRRQKSGLEEKAARPRG